MSQVALYFSAAIIGVLVVGMVVSTLVSKRRNKKTKHHNITPSPSSSPSPSPSVSNFARLNSESASNNLTRKLNENSNITNAYVSSHSNDIDDWFYGVYRGGNDNVSGCC